MRPVQVTLLALSLTIAPAAAQTKSQDESFRREWLLCQAGDVERCNRLLKLPLDAETRSLIEVDLAQARERLSAQIGVLLHLCKDRGLVGACDRALRFNVPSAERAEIMELKKTVVNRSSQRPSR